MKPVMQTDLTFETGNCGEACIASILELKLSDIPPLHNPVDHKDGVMYCKRLREFVSRFGFSYIDMAMGGGHDPKDFFKDCWVIATGPSPHGTEEWHRHGVVWYNGKVEHDPHPSNQGLKEIDMYGVFILKDPSKWIPF